jgi:hypothetical protein
VYSLKVLDIPEAVLKDIIAHARELWSQFYGVVRASGTGVRKRRCDYGCPRGTGDHGGAETPSLAMWVRRRHDAVAGATAACSSDALPSDDTLWTETQQREMEFQEAGWQWGSTFFWGVLLISLGITNKCLNLFVCV